MENLRKEIRPDLKTAERLYPEVLQLILAYTDYCDQNGDEYQAEYKKLENRLHQMTAKDMSHFNLWEWWEEEGAEVLAFKISLPEAHKTENTTKEELAEIIKHQKTFIKKVENESNFNSVFHYQIEEYYFDFLKLNFKTFDPKLFQNNKDKNGNYFEYSQEEIIEKLWTNGEYK